LTTHTPVKNVQTAVSWWYTYRKRNCTVTFW
jgi:hypothetical protein